MRPLAPSLPSWAAWMRSRASSSLTRKLQAKQHLMGQLRMGWAVAALKFAGASLRLPALVSMRSPYKLSANSA